MKKEKVVLAKGRCGEVSRFAGFSLGEIDHVSLINGDTGRWRLILILDFDGVRC